MSLARTNVLTAVPGQWFHQAGGRKGKYKLLPDTQLRAVAVIRMSTDEQIHSPERRRILFHQYCQQWRLRPLSEYTDEGVSAYKTRYFDRPNLTRMLQEADRGGFDIVWVEAIDRLARDEADFFIMRRLLESAGVVLVELGSNPTEKQSALLQGIKALLAANFSRELGTRIANTVQVNVQKGQWPGGKTPTGYKYHEPTKGLAIEDETAPLVRRMFDLFAESKVKAHVTRQLHVEGFSSPRGGRLSVQTVCTILQNPIYRGVYLHKGEPYPMSVPPLVEPELLAQVDAILADERNRPQRAHLAKATWAGLLRCASCGRNLSLHARKERSGNHATSYRCLGARSPYRDCTVQMAETTVERTILPAICTELEQHMQVQPSRRAVKKARGPSLEELQVRRERVQEM